MTNTAQLTLATRVLKMRDDIAQQLMTQQVNGPRVSWIYPAQVVSSLRAYVGTKIFIILYWSLPAFMAI